MVGIDPIKQKKYVVINSKSELEALYNEYKNDIWVGYNSRGYDQWILKAILCGFNPKQVNDFIIVKGRKGHEFSKLFYRVPLNNYDVMPNVPVSLKTLEAFMGKSIVETSVPFDIDRKLTWKEIDETVEYCTYDVMATIEVFLKRKAEFNAYLTLVKRFNLPLSYIGKTKAQLAAVILKATKKPHNDEFDIQFPPTMDVSRYTEVLDFFKNDWTYGESYECVVAGVPHKFATGGVHGAIPKFQATENLLHIDVKSYYPTLNVVYPEICLTRNIKDPSLVADLKDLRLSVKHTDPDLSYALKILINAIGGATKDKYNAMYDPRQNNNMCIGGQVLLLDLIEKLEGHCDLIQSNTDGLIVQFTNYDEVVAICKEWEKRTGAELEYERISKIIQKDVNNYIVVMEDGSMDTKGAYVKKLDDLDYDLPIVNKAVKAYLLDGIPVETTIGRCNELREFQKVVKVSNKYAFAMHNGKRLPEKTFRVFASTRDTDTYIGKCKAVGATNEKFANTPDRCFIENNDIIGVTVDSYPLDKDWYIKTAKERIDAFLGG